MVEEVIDKDDKDGGGQTDGQSKRFHPFHRRAGATLQLSQKVFELSLIRSHLAARPAKNSGTTF